MLEEQVIIKKRNELQDFFPYKVSLRRTDLPCIVCVSSKSICVRAKKKLLTLPFSFLLFIDKKSSAQ